MLVLAHAICRQVGDKLDGRVLDVNPEDSIFDVSFDAELVAAAKAKKKKIKPAKCMSSSSCVCCNNASPL